MRILFNIGLVMFISAGLMQSAWALDGYQKRKGLYYGVGFGGGQAKSDADGAESHITYNFRGRIGGGVDEQLTLDAELSLQNGSDKVANVDVDFTTLLVGIGGNYFVNKGLFIRGTGGIASFESDGGGVSNSETGLYVGGGAGYEFFANSDLAIGVGVDFQHQIYDENNVNALNFGVTANWY